MGFFEFSASTRSKIEIQGAVNHYICIIFYLISALQCSSLLQINNGSQFWKAISYTYLQNIQEGVIIFLHFGIILGFLICFVILLFQIRKAQKQMQRNYTLTNFQIMLCKIINMKLLMFRTIFVIPFVISNLKAIQNQSFSQYMIGILNMTLFFIVIFPISILKFLNCIPNQKTLTYPFTLNLLFIYNLYLPIVAVLSEQSNTDGKLWIANFIYVFLFSISLYLYPIITFTKNQFFIGLISSVTWISICSCLQQLNVTSSINPLITVIVIPVVILSVIKVDEILINNRLKSQEKNLKRLKVFVFCLIHYQVYQFYLENFLKMHKIKCAQKQCPCKKQNDQKNTHLEPLSVQQQNFNKKKVIYEILITQMRRIYLQRSLFSANNRRKEEISQIQQLSIYISEIELNILKKTKKAYTSLREFQNFQQYKNGKSFTASRKKKKFDDYGFKYLLMYNILKQEIQKRFAVQCKQSKSNYNFEAAHYFSYETKIEKYKNYIKESVKNREFIWQQLKHTEPYNQKVTRAILLNLTYHNKIQNLFKNLSENYPEAIIEIFELTNLFCEMILNEDEDQNQSILKRLRHKVKQYHSKVSDAQIKFSMTNKMFSTLSKTAVCVMKADFDNFGQIDSFNFYFQNQFLKPTQKNQRKTTIFDLMIPQLRHQHKIWINQFVQESQSINYNHHNTFILNFQQKVQTANIFIQFKNSIQNGLVCEMFVSFQKEQSQMLLMITNQLEIKAQSRAFSELKSQMMEGNSLSSYLTQKQKNILKNYTNYKKQQDLAYVELKFGNQDYIAEILKSVEILKQSKIKEKQAQQNMILYQLKLISKDRFFQQNHRPLEMINQIYNAEKNVHPTALQTFKIQQQLKLITEKSEQQNQLDQTYQIAMRKLQPKSMKNWSKFAFLIAILVGITLCFEILIIQNKRESYNEAKSLTTKFNQMRITVYQICLEIQKLNIYAFFNETDAAIFSMQRLKISNNNIKFLIPPLVPYMNEKWLVYDIQQSGNILNYYQDQYVIISDYMLTAVTFISNQNVSDLSFSFLYSDIGFLLNEIKIRYEQIYFNGYFTIVVGLTLQKQKIELLVNNNIASYKNQYVYITALIGSVICIIFFVYSSRIQKQCFEIIKLNFGLIQNIDMKSVKQQTRNLKIFKESQSYSKILNRRVNWTKNNLSQMISNTIYACNIPYNENQTERYFLDPQNESNLQQKDLIGKQTSSQHQILMQKKPEHILQAQKEYISNQKNNLLKETNNSNLNINKYDYCQKNQEDNKKTSRFKVTQASYKYNYFTILSISLFFSLFFVASFVGQIYFSQKFSQILQVNSHLYQRKIWLLSTLLDLLVIPTVQIPDFNFFEILLPNIEEAYANERLIYSDATNYPGSNFQKILNQMADSSICEYVHLFSPSTYYNVTFSKSECQNFILSKPLTHGVKASYVYYQQTAVELFKKNSIPFDMTYEQRLQFYRCQELREQLIFYAYLNQAGKLVQTAFQTDTSQIVQNYAITMYILIGCMIILSLIFIIHIKIRIKKLKVAFDIVKSIYILISYKSFKEKKLLTRNLSIIKNMKFLQ